MRRISIFIALIFSMVSLGAQNVLNNNADNIVGTYSGVQKGDKFKAKIVKLTNGTYRGQMIWLEKDKDSDGNKLLDKKNPDKDLRNTPLDRVVIFSGLQYNSKEKQWDGCKIYDPQRGVRAKLVIWFDKEGNLKLKGSMLGISETVTWQKM